MVDFQTDIYDYEYLTDLISMKTRESNLIIVSEIYNLW
jgi:hypothetical protein